MVERTHSWLNRFRRILVRWDKSPANYIAFLHFACARIALRAAGLLVLQRRLDVLLRESFVAQVLLRHLYDVHLRREWASGKRPIVNASL